MNAAAENAGLMTTSVATSLSCILLMLVLSWWENFLLFH